MGKMGSAGYQVCLIRGHRIIGGSEGMSRFNPAMDRLAAKEFLSRFAADLGLPEGIFELRAIKAPHVVNVLNKDESDALIKEWKSNGFGRRGSHER